MANSVLRIYATRTLIVLLKHAEHSALFFPQNIMLLFTYSCLHKGMLKLKCPLPALKRKLESVNEKVGDRGGTVVKVLHHKSESRWFDSRWCPWNFSLT